MFGYLFGLYDLWLSCLQETVHSESLAAASKHTCSCASGVGLIMTDIFLGQGEGPKKTLVMLFKEVKHKV